MLTDLEHNLERIADGVENVDELTVRGWAAVGGVDLTRA